MGEVIPINAEAALTSGAPDAGHTRAGPVAAEAIANTTALALELHRALAAVGITTAMVETGLSDETWLTAARFVDANRLHRATEAGAKPTPRPERRKPPSQATRAAVLAVFRDRDNHPDPFEGF